MTTQWGISKQPHGTFLMQGNYCVARLRDDDKAGRQMYDALTTHEDLVATLALIAKDADALSPTEIKDIASAAITRAQS